jgi:Domain of unknown function DUF29
MNSTYDKDIVAWANEQAALIRSGNFEGLDLLNIAEEIEDVGKSEQREIMSRMAVLLAHLLKWEYQSVRRSKSWERTIQTQRRATNRHIDQTPSLKPKLSNPDWISQVWDDAVLIAEKETGLDVFPELCPWDLNQVLIAGWLPNMAAAD